MLGMAMPELPEVEMARRLVKESIVEGRVTSIDVLDSRMVVKGNVEEMRRAFLLQRVKGTYRHGKNLLIEIGKALLYLHLGMSGSLNVLKTDEHTTHERLRVVVGKRALVLDDPRRFGSCGLYMSEEEFLSEKGLGPDALEISEEEFAIRMAGRRRAVKTALMDQRTVAGIGNLYADEILFQEKVHPAERTDSLSMDELRNLGIMVRKVLGTSIAVHADLSQLPEGYLLRGRNKGEPCPRCATPLDSVRIGGRTTVLCPKCQRFRGEVSLIKT